MEEQAKAMKSLTTGSQNVTSQIKLISAANLEHAESARALLEMLGEIRAGNAGASASPVKSAAAPSRQKTSSRRRASSAEGDTA